MLKLERLMKTLFSSLLLLSFSFTVIGQEINWEELPYQEGEEIIYTVYYNWGFIWVPAGEVKFEVKEIDEGLEYKATGRSFSNYDAIFKVRDYYVSHVDKQSLYPYSFKRDIHEGKYIRFDSISFDQEEKNLVEHFGKTRETAKPFSFEIDRVVHDMVSAIYHLRTRPVETYEKGEQIPIDLFFDKELFSLNINYLGKEKKKIKDLGKCNTYHLQPELIDGYVFSEGDLMDIWVSDEGNRLPLLIESPITFGSVKAILYSAKGLKHEPAFKFPNKG